MKIALGCDHIVTDTKMKISEHLKDLGHEVIDVGTYDFHRTHHPIFGRLIAENVVSGKADLGIALCGTGVGISASADKVPGTRVALVGDVLTARYAKKELNANIIAFGGRILGQNLIHNIVDVFLETEYQPTESNRQLIEKINNIIEVSPEVAKNDHIFDEENAKWARGEYHD